MKVGIVTGGNRGIGFEVVRGLLRESDLECIVVCSRSIENGVKAIESMRCEFGNRVDACEVAQLELSDAKSIETFVDWFKTTHGGYDVLVCNAGVADELQNDER